MTVVYKMLIQLVEPAEDVSYPTSKDVVSRGKLKVVGVVSVKGSITQV